LRAIKQSQVLNCHQVKWYSIKPLKPQQHASWMVTKAYWRRALETASTTNLHCANASNASNFNARVHSHSDKRTFGYKII
jgi:hypothetical protein